MKSSISELLHKALQSLPELADAPELESSSAAVERTRDPRHGDFSSNVALRLAKSLACKPREAAERIAARIPGSELVQRVEIAGPGFINFHLSAAAFHREIAEVLRAKSAYGRQAVRERPKILLEFVSANPTGPLHVGHGRHAAYGDTLGNLLEAAGYPISREYYVNDAGRQMDILGVSVWVRMLELDGNAPPFPSAGYRGGYVQDIAAGVDRSVIPAVDACRLAERLPAEEPAGDREAYVGALIEAAKELLGEDAFDRLRTGALEAILADIREDLEEFGVRFDRWYRERSLITEGRIDDALAVLDRRRMLYRKDGATWFRSSDYGDEKDRVVIRENGKKTYFASDIAYHHDKRRRGFDHLLDVLGADHHGYVARVRAGLEGMGYAGDSLEVQLVQFVALYRGGEKISMSTRAGEFVTLRELREEVGNDAARFFYVMRSNDQHLDFDLELAKSATSENPVYYIQYAHARIASVFRQLAEKSLEWDAAAGVRNLPLLAESHEKTLMSTISRYPEIVDLAAANRAPQQLAQYLRDLANDFHTYYNAHTFIVEDEDLRHARLTLIEAARQVIACGLGLLGVSAPETM